MSIGRWWRRRYGVALVVVTLGIAAPIGLMQSVSALGSLDLIDAGDAVSYGDCTGVAPTLREARDAYARSCEQPRIDCDPIEGLWICSNQRIGDRAPGDPWPRPPAPTTTAVPAPSTTAAPTTVPPTTEPPLTVPPTPSTTVAPAPSTTVAPAPSTTTASTTTAPTTVAPAPSTTAKPAPSTTVAPTPEPPPPAGCVEWIKVIQQGLSSPAAAPNCILIPDDIDKQLRAEAIDAGNDTENIGIMGIKNGKLDLNAGSVGVWHTHPGNTSFSGYDIGGLLSDRFRWDTVRSFEQHTYVSAMTDQTPTNLDLDKLDAEATKLRSQYFRTMSDVESSHWAIYEITRRYKAVYYHAQAGSNRLIKVTASGPANVSNPVGFPG